jgi:hypothetical protein
LPERYAVAKLRFVKKYLSTWTGYRVFCLRMAALDAVLVVFSITVVFSGYPSLATKIVTVIVMVAFLYNVGRMLLHAQSATRHLRRGDPDGDYSVLRSQLHEEKRWGKRLA